VAPGTFGTLAAVPLAWFLPQSLLAYTVIVVLAFVLGVWLCEHCTRDLGLHDHGSIVWDEWVGFFIALYALPRQWWIVLLAFLLFRLFDVLKPWPIGFIDKQVGGGFGIMIDDVLAGVMAALVLHAVLALGWLPIA